MEQYVKVEKPKVETPIDENEIRITSQGRMRSYISYALTLLQEKNANEIVFKAMGRAINKTVTIVELIKRRIVGLHQITSIGSTDITDTWEPLEEGLLPLETTRHVSMITIILSKNDMDTSAVGYQPPLPADQVKPSNDYDFDGEGSPSARGRGPGGRGRGGRGRGRGRGRGPIGNGFASLEYEDSGWDQNRDYPQGRGRGRGRNFRGRGRGGYGYSGSTDDSQQFDGYNRGPPGQGGRGRGGYSYNGPIEDNQQFDRGYNRGPPGQGVHGRGRYGYDGPIDDNQQFDGGYSRGRGRGGRRGGRGRGGGRSSGPAQAVEGGT